MREASKGALRGAGTGKGSGEGKIGEPAMEGDSQLHVTSVSHLFPGSSTHTITRPRQWNLKAAPPPLEPRVIVVA